MVVVTNNRVTHSPGWHTCTDYEFDVRKEAYERAFPEQHWNCQGSGANPHKTQFTDRGTGSRRWP